VRKVACINAPALSCGESCYHQDR